MAHGSPRPPAPDLEPKDPSSPVVSGPLPVCLCCLSSLAALQNCPCHRSPPTIFQSSSNYTLNTTSVILSPSLFKAHTIASPLRSRLQQPIIRRVSLHLQSRHRASLHSRRRRPQLIFVASKNHCILIQWPLAVFQPSAILISDQLRTRTTVGDIRP